MKSVKKTSRLILKYKNNIKKTWDVIKDAIGKNKSTQSSFPNKIIHKTKTIADAHVITEIAPNLANNCSIQQNINLVLTN